MAQATLLRQNLSKSLLPQLILGLWQAQAYIFID
jgi:hypothetical protein